MLRATQQWNVAASQEACIVYALSLFRSGGIASWKSASPGNLGQTSVSQRVLSASQSAMHVRVPLRRGC